MADLPHDRPVAKIDFARRSGSTLVLRPHACVDRGPLTDGSVAPRRPFHRRWIPLLEAYGSSKRFDDLQSNGRRRRRAVCRTRSSAILGENGPEVHFAKSLYGVHKTDSGSILWEGERGLHRLARQGTVAGIGLVFPDFRLVPALRPREHRARSTRARGPRMRRREVASRQGSRRALQVQGPRRAPAFADCRWRAPAGWRSSSC